MLNAEALTSGRCHAPVAGLSSLLLGGVAAEVLLMASNVELSAPFARREKVDALVLRRHMPAVFQESAASASAARSGEDAGVVRRG